MLTCSIVRPVGVIVWLYPEVRGPVAIFTEATSNDAASASRAAAIRASISATLTGSRSRTCSLAGVVVNDFPAFGCALQDKREAARCVASSRRRSLQCKTAERERVAFAQRADLDFAEGEGAQR